MNPQNNRPVAPVEEIGSTFERVSSLFQVDTLAAQQYHDTYRRKIPQQAEMRLILAVLEDAINAYQDNLFALNKKRIQLFRDAEDWFFSNDASWIFSFESICSILNLDPDYFRQGLRRWAAAQSRSRKAKARPTVIQDRLVA